MSKTQPTLGPWYAIPHPEWAGAKVRIDTRPDVPWANFGEIAYVHPRHAELIASAPAMKEELGRLQEALTPSAATKAAYIGEFSMPFPVCHEDGSEQVLHLNVPWITIKKIMAAIRARAALTTEDKG